jgi:hypothetical protein
VLLPVHSCPCKLGWLQTVVEVALALRVGKKENLNAHKIVRINCFSFYKRQVTASTEYL